MDRDFDQLHQANIKQITRPAIALKTGAADGMSKFGGLPDAPSDMTWPRWNGVPQAFLAQIDLAELKAKYSNLDMPNSGYLYFFSEPELENFGFEAQDRGSWAVKYADCPHSQSSPLAPPEDLDDVNIYTEAKVELSAIDSLPCMEALDGEPEELGIDDDEYDDYREKPFNGKPLHQMFGYPTAVQTPFMDSDCHEIFCELYPEESDASVDDWVMLLQLDTDYDVDFIWREEGRIYFWIRKDDLANGRFDRCWRIMQMY